MKKTYYIKTFGCQSNVADSERVESALQARGMTAVQTPEKADYVVINTCMVRQSAENRVYGLVRNLGKARKKTGLPKKITLTGCMVGLATYEKTGKMLAKLRAKLPEVDEFLPIDEVGFDHVPVRTDLKHAWVPISNGCNNHCTFCIVPHTRGPEVSRAFEDILSECKDLKEKGYESVMLLGQNVNSYGSDLVKTGKFDPKNIPALKDKKVEPVVVKHLGRHRIPTLFPYLLEAVVELGFAKVDFMSSNPWDFSDELIDVIARYDNVTRVLHLPVQSGDDEILKQMNRWYTRDEYLDLVDKIKSKIPDVELTTDIIVGFPGETDEQFEQTVDLCKQIGFTVAFISKYSPRLKTKANEELEDDVPFEVKRERWRTLEGLINHKS